MDEPITIRRQWRKDEWAWEFWFMFEDRVFVQRSVDGIEWKEPECTPYQHVPFIQMSNLTPF